MRSWFGKRDPIQHESADPAPRTNGNAQECAARPDELEELMMAVKGRTPATKREQVSAERMFPVGTFIADRPRREEEARRRALEEAIRTAKPGQPIEGQGIFLCRYTPKDRDGNSLSQTFNVFAAPEDLKDEETNQTTHEYIDAALLVSRLKNWHGFDGSNYPTDKELYQALKDGSYNGEWVIPTIDLLDGHDKDYKDTQPDNLHAHKDTWAFKDTFKTAADNESGQAGDYWSCTEHRFDPEKVLMTRFGDTYKDAYYKDSLRMRCRPVRLAPVAQGGLQP